MTSIEQTKTTNFTKNLLNFIVLISFCSSTLDTTNDNFHKTIDYDKLISGDLYFLKDEYFFKYLNLLIEDEFKTIIFKNSIEGFNETLFYKLVFKIHSNIIISNCQNIPIKETNKILDVLFNLLKKVLYLESCSDDFKLTVLWVIEIYSSYEIERQNFNDYNSIIFFLTTKKNLNFFLMNLSNNEKLKKLTFNIITSYTILISRDIILDFYEQRIIKNLFDGSVLKIIKNNDSCKKIYFEIMDIFLINFEIFFDFEILIDRRCYKILYLLEELFKSPYYLENITDFDILINVLKKITDILLYNNKKEIHYLSIYTIQFYTKYIAKINIENNEKICRIIEIFEENIYKFLILLNSFNINLENFDFHRYSYYEINKYLYDFCINFENEKYNNPYLANKIKDTFYEYSTKILIYELDNIYFEKT